MGEDEIGRRGKCAGEGKGVDGGIGRGSRAGFGGCFRDGEWSKGNGKRWRKEDRAKLYLVERKWRDDVDNGRDPST